MDVIVCKSDTIDLFIRYKKAKSIVVNTTAEALDFKFLNFEDFRMIFIRYRSVSSNIGQDRS